MKRTSMIRLDCEPLENINSFTQYETHIMISTRIIVKDMFFVQKKMKEVSYFKRSLSFL